MLWMSTNNGKNTLELLEYIEEHTSLCWGTSTKIPTNVHAPPEHINYVRAKTVDPFGLVGLFRPPDQERVDSIEYDPEKFVSNLEDWIMGEDVYCKITGEEQLMSFLQNLEEQTSLCWAGNQKPTSKNVLCKIKPIVTTEKGLYIRYSRHTKGLVRSLEEYQHIDPEAFVQRFSVLQPRNKKQRKQQEVDPHQGMVWNPISETWSWGF